MEPAKLGDNLHRCYESLAAHAEADPAWLMEEVFRFCDVRFYRRYEQVLDVSRGEPWARWCVGGTTNIVLNCIDRHHGTPAWDHYQDLLAPIRARCPLSNVNTVPERAPKPM